MTSQQNQLPSTTPYADAAFPAAPGSSGVAGPRIGAREGSML